ncbi:MAG: phosphate/phosphite/phosphonate ABC transporter substrate-binding protein [Xanthomonadales bacterium]|nr:phosphate/phosphite/phosphonate ABC transporter substrate-binding protein [Xanthomonadales bacterium]
MKNTTGTPVLLSVSLFLLGGLLTSQTSAEELTLVAQPNYPQERSAEVYAPLIEYLNATSGHTITLKSPRDFQHHWLSVRNGDTPDLVLEDAPLTDYRIQNQGYTPLVRVKEEVSYSILTGGAYADDQLDQFVGRIISTLAAPSLGYLVLLDAFPNPFSQPAITSSATAWLDGVEMTFSMEADAAVAPIWLVEQYQNLYPVYTSKNFPGLTLSASSSVSDEVKDAITEALLKLHEDENGSHFSALHELNATEMIKAEVSDYAGYKKMLGQLYGGN